jgi:carbon monoxide dehydrogenase subunit G
MPGAEIVSVSDDQSEIEGRMRTKVGPISAAFGGRGKVVRDASTYTGSVEGSGADKNSGSRVQMKLTYALEPSDGDKSTTTSIVAGVVLSGPLAQFGKGALINEIAAHLTQQFTANLRQRLAANAAGPNSEQATIPAVESASAGELRPLQLLIAVLKGRIKNLFMRLTG